MSAWGYWGDILNSPFHSFGTACDERSFFKISNKQFVHTSVAVAEYNVTVGVMRLPGCTSHAASMLHKHASCRADSSHAGGALDTTSVHRQAFAIDKSSPGVCGILTYSGVGGTVSCSLLFHMTHCKLSSVFTHTDAYSCILMRIILMHTDAY